MNQEEIFAKLTEFLTEYKDKPTKLKISDYRLFYGNIRLSMEWLKRRTLTKSQTETAQKVNALLTNWQNNYNSKLGISKEGLEILSREFSELLSKMLDKKSINIPTPNWEETLKEAESGLKWLNWWKRKKKWVIGLGIAGVLIVLLALVFLVKKAISYLF